MSVHQHRPWLCPLLLILTVLILWLAGIFLYVNIQADNDEINKKLADRNLQLEQALVAIKRSIRIEQHTFLDVQQNLRNLMHEHHELKEELTFYKSLIAGKIKHPSIKIKKFTVMNTATNHYEYSFILTQVAQNAKRLTGTLTIKLTGVQAGKVKTLNLSDLGQKSVTNLGFDLHYFQRLQGRWILPNDFTPEQVKLEIKTPTAKSSQRLSFAWHTILTEESPVYVGQEQKRETANES